VNVGHKAEKATARRKEWYKVEPRKLRTCSSSNIIIMMECDEELGM
jgi:hypothetical protein